MATFIITSYTNSFEISKDGHTKEFQRGVLSYDDDPDNNQILDINTTQSRQQLYRIDLSKDSLDIDGQTVFADSDAIKIALRPFFFRSVGGGVTSLSVTAPITDSGTATDPIIGITQASAVSDGYLSSTDWNTFNNKLDSIAITDEVIPKGTGTSIENGSWQFSGNDILPVTTGSNIGSATNRIGTIFMSSVVDYSTDLIFNNAARNVFDFKADANNSHVNLYSTAGGFSRVEFHSDGISKWYLNNNSSNAFDLWDTTNNKSVLRATATAVLFNNSNADRDFRIGKNVSGTAFEYNAGTDLSYFDTKLGVGETSPSHMITVLGDGSDLLLLKDQLDQSLWEFKDSGEIFYKNGRFLLHDKDNNGYLLIGENVLPNADFSDSAPGITAIGNNILNNHPGNLQQGVAVGQNLLQQSTTNRNFVFGSDIFEATTTAQGLFGFGFNIGSGLTTGGDNIAIGRQVFYDSTSIQKTLSFTADISNLNVHTSKSIYFGTSEEYNNIFFNEDKSGGFAPADFTIKYASAITNSDVPGGDVIIKYSGSTGSGAGGKGIFQGTKSGVSGTTQNPHVDLLVLDPEGNSYFENTKLGIGETSPTHTLTVRGSGEDLLLVKDQLNQTVFNVNDDGVVNIENNELYFGGSRFLSTDTSKNILIGEGVGSSLTTGFNNIIIGENSGNSLTDRHNNVIIGDNAGKSLSTNAIGNTLLGAQSGGNANMYGTTILRNSFASETSFNSGLTIAYSNFIGDIKSTLSSGTLGNSQALGRNINVDHAYCVVLGEWNAGTLNTTSSYQFIATPNNCVWGGSPEESIVSPNNVIHQTPNKNGITDNTSGSFTIQTGKSTGSAFGGDIIFKGSVAGASGTTQNVQTAIFTISPSNGVTVESGFSLTTEEIIIDTSEDTDFKILKQSNGRVDMGYTFQNGAQLEMYHEDHTTTPAFAGQTRLVVGGDNGSTGQSNGAFVIVGVNNDAGTQVFKTTNTGFTSLTLGTAVNEFSTDGTLAGNSDDSIPTEQAVKTYIDNRVNTPSVDEQVSTATLTVNSDVNQSAILTALATNLTIAAPTGTPSQGQKLILRIKDDGTSRTTTWNAIFRAVGVTLPANTTISKTLYVGCVYNTTDSKWDVLAVNEEA